MKINDMDKYQLTELMKKVKETITDPEISLFDVPNSVIEEMLNPPTDKDGYVHKYYLNNDTKLMVELLSRIMSMPRSSEGRIL